MKAIILAAGKGSRLGEYTQGQPKCLLKLGNETILSREIRMLREAGILNNDIFVVGGYQCEKLEGIAPNLVYNHQFDVKDNSYSLALGLHEIGESDVLVLDGDLCFETELLIELIGDKRKNVLLSRKSMDLSESTGIITENDGRVRAIGKQYHDTGYVYLSIFKIGADTVDDLRLSLLTEQAERTWYPLAITSICGKHPFYNRVTEQKWHEIDFVEDYIQTKALFEIK